MVVIVRRPAAERQGGSSAEAGVMNEKWQQ
jgi:hypothetical protein